MNKSRGARTPVVLIVLDGWGFRPGREGNAIELGQTPTWHRLWARAPRTLLDASGLAVGLPRGQMGNSEVGHLNLGAGRVVPQDIVRISQAIDSGEFFRIPALVELCDHVKRRDATLHVAGLIGTGGVHALDTHLLAAVELGRRHDVPVAIHAWLDGRDSPPKSGLGFMEDLVEAVGRSGGRAVVSTVVGRYYAMDRDKRWERTKLAYDAMVAGVGAPAPDPVTAVTQAYGAGEADEFVQPRVITGAPRIREGDGIFCFNFRADRMRQIVRALAVPGFDGFDVRDRPAVRLVTMTQYDETFPFPVAFGPMTLHRILAEVLAERGKTMFRTAETEKYAHVTYFFNGGYEEPYRGEERLLVPSQKVATYDLKPEMSAAGVTDVLCRAIEARQHDFILCNYANADMVGHSGVLAAAVTAVETVDACLAQALQAADGVGATGGPAAGGRFATRRRTHDSSFTWHRTAGRDDGAGSTEVGLMERWNMGTWERGNVGRLAALAVFFSIFPTFHLSAQVGHDPARSPFRDVLLRGGPVFFGGHLAGERGRAGVGPSNALTFGIRYEIPLGRSVVLQLGPTYLRGDRFIADPTEPETSPTRRVGPVDTEIMIADVGLQVRLTGGKSWRGLAPFVGVGAGLAIDLNSPGDTTGSGYKFGSKIVLSGVLGTRLHLSPRISLQADARAMLWRLRYPVSFHAAASDGTRVVPLEEPLTDWALNPWVSLGVGWIF